MQEETKKDDENQEPKLDELEKLVEYFRHAFGEEHLMSSIKESKINDIIDKTEKAESEQKYKYKEEVKIPIGQSIEKENNPQHFVYSNPEIQNAKSKTKEERVNPKHDFKSSLLYVLRGTKNALKLKRYRYPLITFGVFLGIFIAFNLPVYYAQISWKKPETVKTVVTTQETYQKQMNDSAVLDPGETIPSESRLVIPKINVNVPIIYLNSRAETDIQNSLRDGVVHYQGTAKPGDIGNSFITGHSSNYWWEPGKYNYVFVLLDKLEAGDKVTTYYNNKKFVFTVRDKIVVDPTDVSVLAPTTTPVLSLMTCTPPGTSWKRLVVRLDRTDPAYYQPELITKQKIVETPVFPIKQRSFWDTIISIFTPN